MPRTHQYPQKYGYRGKSLYIRHRVAANRDRVRRKQVYRRVGSASDYFTATDQDQPAIIGREEDSCNVAAAEHEVIVDDGNCDESTTYADQDDFIDPEQENEDLVQSSTFSRDNKDFRHLIQTAADKGHIVSDENAEILLKIEIYLDYWGQLDDGDPELMELIGRGGLDSSSSGDGNENHRFALWLDAHRCWLEAIDSNSPHLLSVADQISSFIGATRTEAETTACVSE